MYKKVAVDEYKEMARRLEKGELVEVLLDETLIDNDDTDSLLPHDYEIVPGATLELCDPFSSASRIVTVATVSDNKITMLCKMA